MLVTDTLNVVLAIAIVKQGRAFQRFDDPDGCPIDFLEVITAASVPEEPEAETKPESLRSPCAFMASKTRANAAPVTAR